MTRLDPEQLLDALLEIERRHGRVREMVNGPRTRDLDVQIYGDRELATDRLSLPHPRAHERAFVLHALLEISPDIVMPGRGLARKWLAACADQPITRVADESTLRRAVGSVVDVS